MAARTLIIGVLIAALAVPFEVGSTPAVRAASVGRALAPVPGASGDGFLVDVAGPAAVAVGESAEYTFTITNLDVDAIDVDATIGASYDTATMTLLAADGWTCSQGALSTQMCSRPTLASSATTTIVVAVEAFDGPNLSVFGDVSDMTSTIIGDASLEVEVEGVADLGLSTISPDVSLGAAYEVPFVVRNVGSGFADFGGPIDVSLRPHFYDPGSGSLGDGGVTVDGDGWTCSHFSCSHPGPVPAGGDLPPLVASGVFVSDGSINATIDDDDDLYLNNGATASVLFAGSDPAVTVRNGGPLTAGQPGQFLVDVSNQGDEAAAGTLAVVIETSLESPNGTGSGWACDTADVVTCTNDSAILDPYSVEQPITVAGTVPAGADTLAVSATIAPGGVHALNDTSNADFVVTTASFDLTVDLTSDSDVLTPGSPIELTTAVSNVGVGEATGPVTLTLSTPAVVGNADGSGWTCGEDFGGWTCSHPGPVPASTTLPDVIVTGTVDSYVYDGSMSATVSPGGTSGNDSFGLVLPIELPDLEVAIEANPTDFDEGALGEFTATVTNLGPGVAHGAVTATLSASYDFANFVVDGGADWVCAEEFSSWTCDSFGPISAGDSLAPITMTGTPDGWNETVRGSVWASLGDAAEGDDNNNFSFVDVPVRPLIDLSVGARVVGGLTVGSVGSVEVVVEQLGIGTVPAGEIEVSLSGSPLVDVSAVGTNWSCTSFYSGASCVYLAGVAPGESIPVLIYSGDVEPTYAGFASTYVSVYHPEDKRYENDYVTIEDPVEAPVDLVVDIVDSGPFVAGVETTYMVTVRNVGANASAGTVNAWIYLPGGIDIVGATGPGWTCSFASCDRSDAVEGGASFDPITFVVLPGSSYDGTVTTTAQVSGGGDGNTGNNLAEVITAFPPALDAAIIMQPATSVFLVGNPNEYLLTVTNEGTDEFPGPFTVDADLDFDFTGVVGAGTDWTCTPSSERSISCEHPGPLPVGGQLPALTLIADLASTSFSVWSSGYLTAAGDQRSDNDWTSVATDVAGESDLTIAVADTTTTFGEAFSMEAIVNNVLATEAVGAVDVSFEGYFYTAPGAIGTDWDCGLGEFGRVVCTHPGPVPASGSLPPITFTATAGVTFAGTGDVFVEVRGATDATNWNDYANSIVTIASPVDLTIDVDDRDATIPAGGTGEIDVVVTNVGTATATGPIRVDGRTFGATSLAGVGTGWTCGQNGGGLDCEHPGPLDAGSSLPTLIATVEAPPYDTNISTTYEVNHPDDGRSGNNTAGVVTPVESQVDLTVAVDDGVAFFTAGQSGDYEVVVSNVGTSMSEGEITVDLDTRGPAGLDAASGTGWSCSITGTTGTCTTTSPVPAAAVLPTITVTVQTTTGGGNEVSLDAEVSGGGDANLFDNTATHSTILASPDLTVDVDDGGASFIAPGTGTYTVTVGNTGAVPTVGDVSVGFAITGPIEVATAAGDGWDCAAAPDVVCSRSDALDQLGTYPVLTVEVNAIVTDDREASLTVTAVGFDANPGNERGHRDHADPGSRRSHDLAGRHVSMGRRARQHG